MRDFSATPEPSGRSSPAPGRRLVVQRHFARREHYDLRLEMDGVLKSWAVTRGPSANPRSRRLAVRTEDHPLDYADFEGVIPQGEYGGGTVLLWESASFAPLAADPLAALAAGELKFEAFGQRMRGRWTLVRMNVERGRENWLLIKERDAYAEEDDGLIERFPASVSTGRDRSQIEAGAPARAPGKTKGAAPPAFIPPMLCGTAPGPPAGEGWLFEMKYDGYRLQIAVDGEAVALRTRTGLDWTARFPAVAAAARALGRRALIDGEAVVLDERGLSDFPALVAALDTASGGVIEYYAFDLLELDGESLREAPLVERKRRLEALLKGRSGAISYAAHLAGDGAKVFASAVAAGAEGVVAKRADSPWRSGRSDAWLKVKADLREDVLIVGYMPSDKGELFASLLMAMDRDDRRVFVGRVGTGFDAPTRAAVWKKLEARATVQRPDLAGPPTPRGAVFLDPFLRADVRFGGWTGAGQLRQGRFLGLREDLPMPPARKPAKAGTSAAKPAAKPTRETAAPRLSRAPIAITHPERVVFPADGVTKGDVAAYYETIADRIGPHLADRPVSLIRAPDGIEGELFFQRHPLKGMTRGVIPVADPASGESYMALAGAEGLRTAAQFGVLELHGWMSRTDRLGYPDRMVFDLDPDEGLDFRAVRAAAVDLRDHLAAAGLASWPMTTGGKGVHVVAPLERSLDAAAVESFAAGFARALAAAKPDRYVATMSKARRKGRIFIDWLRNKRLATAVLPWSLRARPGAPVAVPLDWAGLARAKSARLRSIADAAKAPDPWGDFFACRQTIPDGALKLLGVAS